MTEKEKLKDIKKLADAMYYAAQYLTTDASRLHKAMDEYHKFIIYEWREEPVSEDLNTESMIESYKQRLISQANGMKNSPLIDMCLVSYKHGINETLDTLKLSNIERTVKNWEEPVSEDLGEYINELSKQFPEVSFAKLSRIAVRVARWQRNQDVKNKLPKVISRTDLDEYAYQCAYDMSNDWAIENPTWKDVEDACKLGAKWQKEHLWKPADGDDLPEYDREVIVLIKYNTQRNIHDEEYPTYRVGFGHRPNPDGWDGKNIDTNEVTHYTPKLYDKGGWNAPDVKYWLDVELPKEIEL